MLFENGNLKDVKLIKNKLNGYLYPSLTITYEYNDKFGNIHELVIKNVDLPIYLNPKYISQDTVFEHFSTPEGSIDIGYGKIGFSKNTMIEDKIIKYVTKEMTIEEIEKKLGHKVKIVGEKGE